MKLYLDLFVTGVAISWGACFLFCAPAVFPFIIGTQKNWFGGLKVALTFSVARILPYVILSVASAGIGQYLVSRFYQTQSSLFIHIATGSFVFILGIIVLLGKTGHVHFCSGLIKKMGSEKGIWPMIALGLLVGFAPCAPLFAVLTYIAFNAQNLIHGALLGLVFGIGTLISPLVLIAPLMGNITELMQKKPWMQIVISRLSGVMLLYLGVNMLIRVTQAW